MLRIATTYKIILGLVSHQSVRQFCLADSHMTYFYIHSYARTGYSSVLYTLLKRFSLLCFSMLSAQPRQLTSRKWLSVYLRFSVRQNCKLCTGDHFSLVPFFVRNEPNPEVLFLLLFSLVCYYLSVLLWGSRVRRITNNFLTVQNFN